MDRSVEFYSKLFRKSPSKFSKQYSEFDLAPMQFGLINKDNYWHKLVNGNNCIPTFEVQNIDYEQKRIGKFSERVSDLRSVGSYILFEFADPDGNVLECFYISDQCDLTSPSVPFVKVAATKAVDDWFEDYVSRVYGIEDGKYRAPKGQKKTGPMSATDFGHRLSARFNELDLVPKDGLVSYLEIERALSNPLLHWDELDIAMLKLLRKYYHSLIELSDDERERMDQGISLHDVETLVSGIDERVERFRVKFQEEQENN
jgi:predicted enzyme related to lactoylglutathione lyase